MQGKMQAFVEHPADSNCVLAAMRKHAGRLVRSGPFA